MADAKKYKQYIFKDGDYREVVGSHTVSGESKSVGNGDIEIKIDIVKEVHRNGNAIDFASVFSDVLSHTTDENDNYCFGNDPRFQFLRIVSSPITSEFEEAIRNGTGVIRFDYPITRNRRRGFYGKGHKSFARNLYLKENADAPIMINHYADKYLNGIIFLTEDDIKENYNGEKIIIKKISMEELAKRMVSFIYKDEDTGNIYTREFDDFSESILKDWATYENYQPYYGSKYYHFLDLIPTFYRPFGHGDVGSHRNDITNFATGPANNNYVLNCEKKEAVFPMFIKAKDGESFDDNCIVSNKRFCGFSIYSSIHRKKTVDGFIINYARMLQGGIDRGYYSSSEYDLTQKYICNMMAKPRLAIIKPDYENIGSDNVALSIWGKTYKQSERNINLRFACAFGDHDLINISNSESMMFVMRCQLSDK